VTIRDMAREFALIEFQAWKRRAGMPSLRRQSRAMFFFWRNVMRTHK